MKRKRVVNAKPSRNGCKTCRLRRVKCDEARPRCAVCTSSDRLCEYGVRVLPVASNHSSRALLPSRRKLHPYRAHHGGCSRALSLSSPEVSTIFSFSDTEDRIAYDYFLNVVVTPIATTSPTQEWIHLALQHCTIKPVFHAMAAVGYSYRSNGRIYHATLTHQVQSPDLDAALGQYNKAVNALQQYINEVVEHGAAIEPVLLSSILLTCYEVMLDRKGSAQAHYRLGRRIAAQSQKAVNRKSPSSPPSPNAIKQLAVAFWSLDTGGEYYWNQSERVVRSSSSIQRKVPGSIPTTFASFIEADMYLERLVRAAQDFRNDLVALAQKHVSRTHGPPFSSLAMFCLANCLSRSIEIPKRLQHRLDEISSAHLSWITKLRTLSSQNHTTHDQISLLTQVRYFSSWLVLSTCRETKETLIDRFEPDFVRVLDLTERYLREASGRPQPVPPPQICVANGLSFEGGILPALHLIACKSRSSVIRRRATTSLRSANRQELTCHSGVIGSLVVCVAELEEQRSRAIRGDAGPALLVLESKQIPEEARFADCVMKINMAPGPSVGCASFSFAFARYLHDQEGRIEILQYCSEEGAGSLRLESRAVYDCSAKENAVLLSVS